MNNEQVIISKKQAIEMAKTLAAAKKVLDQAIKQDNNFPDEPQLSQMLKNATKLFGDRAAFPTKEVVGLLKKRHDSQHPEIQYLIKRLGV